MKTHPTHRATVVFAHATTGSYLNHSFFICSPGVTAEAVARDLSQKLAGQEEPIEEVFVSSINGELMFNLNLAHLISLEVVDVDTDTDLRAYMMVNELETQQRAKRILDSKPVIMTPTGASVGSMRRM